MRTRMYLKYVYNHRFSIRALRTYVQRHYAIKGSIQTAAEKPQLDVGGGVPLPAGISRHEPLLGSLIETASG
jgi:hypothetical protein